MYFGWEGLSTELTEALLAGQAQLHSNTPLTLEERFELIAGVEKLSSLLLEVTRLVASMAVIEQANVENIQMQMTASGERIREELRDYNQGLQKLLRNESSQPADRSRHDARERR
jgi:hypothetical protein